MADAATTPEGARLLLDAMLGKLATYLRMCGYDAAYALDREARSASERTSGEERERGAESREIRAATPRAGDDPRGVETDEKLLDIVREESRLLVTRDAELARRADDRALLLESKDVTDQLRELASAGFELDLSEPARCSACNAKLVAVEDSETTPEYAPDPDERRVWRCPACGQYFWKGTHWESVAETLRDL